MRKIISCLLMFVMVMSSFYFCAFAVEADLQIQEFYVQLGGNTGETYTTVIDDEAETITLAIPASKAGRAALGKAKITYRANGEVSCEKDSIYQDISSPLQITVSDGEALKTYTLKTELTSVQRDYNFNSASLMAANHATKERRKACGYVSATGSGMWYNFGYAFDSNGNQIADETYGVIDLESTAGGKNLMLTKTKTGGELGVASVAAGSDYVRQTDVFTSSVRFCVGAVECEDGESIFTYRSSNVDTIHLIKAADGLKIGYTATGSDELYVKEDYIISESEWHTLSLTFTKNDYTQSGYSLDVKLDDKFMFATEGILKDSDGNVIQATGQLVSEAANNVYQYDKVAVMILMGSDVTGNVKIDDFKCFAKLGTETAADDSTKSYTYEYIEETDPGTAGGNLDKEPDMPDIPEPPVDEKPESPEFDGVLDLGFENGGTGWETNPVNLAANGDFEEESIWRLGSTDANTFEYTTQKAYTGKKSMYIEYPVGSVPNRQAGVRNYTAYTINPLSEYRLAMALIYHPTGDNPQYRAMFSFRTKNEGGTTIQNEAGDFCTVREEVTDWKYIDDSFTSTTDDETVVEMFMPRLAGEEGTYAYFDSLYFGTACHATVLGDSYSGEGVMFLGAYNGLHGEEKVSSIDLDVRELRTYTIDACVSGRAGNAKAIVGIEFYDEDGKLICSALSEGTSDKWVKESVSASAPEGAKTMKLILKADGSGSVLFDHVSYKMEEQSVEAIENAGDGILLVGSDESGSYKLAPYAVDAYGMPVEGFEAKFELAKAVDGVKIDGTRIYIDKKVKSGTELQIVVTADSITVEYVLTVVRGSVEISGAKKFVRKNQNVSKEYEAILACDGKTEKLPAYKLIWSIDGASDMISVENGIVTVGKNTPLGTYTLIAEYADNPNICDKFEITVEKEATGGSGGGGGGSSSGSGFGGSQAGIPAQTTVPSQVARIPSFDDVTLSFWGYEAITNFAKRGYISGDGSSDFRVNDNITRAEFLKILLMVMEVEFKEYETEFNDVKKDSWYYGYVATANALGIANGMSRDTFAPESDITREDMAVLVSRASQMAGIKLDMSVSKEFSDGDMIADYAKAAVSELASAGVINGTPDGSFAPKSNATRAEAVQMLYNLIRLR